MDTPLLDEDPLGDTETAAKKFTASRLIRQAPRRRVSVPDIPGVPHPNDLLKASVIADYNNARGQALPLAKAANHETFMRYFTWGDPNHDPQKKKSAKVSLWRLLSYSTWQECLLMIFGALMATVSGLGLPAWLILLASTLDTLSNLATLTKVVGEEGIMDYL